MSVFIHNTIFVIQNGVERNEESIKINGIPPLSE